MIAKFGLIPFERSLGALADNVTIINGALNAPGGADVELPAGEFFLDSSLITGPVISERLSGAGCGYQQTTRNPVNGRMSVLTSVAPEKKLPVLRVRCNSLTGGRFEIRGQPYLWDPDGGGARGEKIAVGIAFESRLGPWTGLHDLEHITVSECKTAIDVLGASYDESSKLVAGDFNNDNSTIEKLLLSNCDVGVHIANGQACAWTFRDVRLFGWGGRSKNDFVLCDVERGGDVKFDSVSMNHPQATVFRVARWSPQTRTFTAHNVRSDRYYKEPNYLTLFEYTGPPDPDAHFDVEITGTLNNMHVAEQFDAKKLIRIPKTSAIPLDGFRIKMAGMPTDGFVDIGGGFWRPTPALFY
jgi:hypothetical protein